MKIFLNQTKLFFVATFLFISTMVSAQYTAVPDSNFESALFNLGLDDISGDGQVPTAQIEGVTNLNVNDKNIADLTGIEDFLALVDLSFRDNAVTSIDLSNNLNLKYLECRDNLLSALDVTNNIELNSLRCNRNNITILDLTRNIDLQILVCSANDLTEIDLRAENFITTLFLNINNNPNLNCVYVDDAIYSTYNWDVVGSPTNFSEENCGYFAIPDANFEARLGALGYDDISFDGQVPYNLTAGINTLDLSNANIVDLSGIELFTELTTLNIANNSIQYANLNGLTSLSSINASNNDLSTLDFSALTNLSTVDLTSNSNLKCVFVFSEAVSSGWTQVDPQTIFTETNLCYISIPDSNFESRLFELGYDDIANDGKVPTELVESVTSLNLTGANISNVTGIRYFSSLKNLDLSENNFTSLVLDFLNLTSLTLRDLPNLNTLVVNDNDLHFLNIKTGNNPGLTSIDIRNNPNLTCVLVEDLSFATNNWTNKDPQTNYTDTYCTLVNYEFNNNLEDTYGLHDASYLDSSILEPSYNANYTSILSETGFLSSPTEGVVAPKLLSTYLFSDQSVEFEMDFSYTNPGTDEGFKDVFTLRKDSDINRAGFSIWARALNATEYYFTLYWNDDNGLNGGGDRITTETFTVGEEMNIRFMIDIEAREWYFYAGNYFNSGNFKEHLDLDYLLEDIKDTPIYLGNYYKIQDRYSATSVTDNFKIHVPARPTDVVALKNALVLMTDHILGNIALTPEETSQYRFEIISNVRYNYMNARTEVDNYLAAFEANLPPLFQDRLKINLTDLSDEEMVTFYLQQDILDNAFVSENIDNVIGVKFDFANVYPGPVSSSAPRVSNQVVTIDGTYLLDPGYELMGQSKGVYRPIGYYAAPGELVTITTPPAFINSGIEVVVGTPSRDANGQAVINRLHRIKKEFEITSEITKIANPVGGGIYIKIPANVDLRWIDFTVNGAVKSPYFRMITDQPVNLAEFQTDLANAYVNWVDMESDRMMFTIPLDIVDITDPTNVMTTWNTMWDAFSVSAGRPVDKIRAEYWLIDCAGITNNAGYPTDIGYDFFNNTTRDLFWNPLRVVDADYIDNYPSTVFHEMGHNVLMPEPPGEAENIVQLLGTPMLVNGLGYDIDDALKVLQTANPQDRDLAAMNWMVSTNFRTNTAMGCEPDLGPAICSQLDYQVRGSMKWHEIASLYDFETLGKIQKVFYDATTVNGYNTSNPGEISREDLIRAATEATGINLTSLLHFWGYIPSNAEQTEFDTYTPSSAFCERLEYYRSIVPLTQADYLPWHNQLIATTSDYFHSQLIDVYNNYETQDISGQILAQIDLIASLYCNKSLLEPKAYLQGAILEPNTGEENLMRDDLRVLNLIPLTSPYIDGLACESSVLEVTGDNAIVDWVWIELRDPIDNTLIIDQKSALLQRDGDVVSTDGVSPIYFNRNSNDYYIAIKHRNHLGIMTNSDVNLSVSPTIVNFTQANNPITFGSNAQTIFGMPSGTLGMWAGNANNDLVIQYSGAQADSPFILSEVLNDPGNFLNFPTFTLLNYNNKDLNMDGNTQYSGSNPDTTLILQNVLAHLGNFLGFSTFVIQQQIP